MITRFALVASGAIASVFALPTPWGPDVCANLGRFKWRTPERAADKLSGHAAGQLRVIQNVMRNAKKPNQTMHIFSKTIAVISNLTEISSKVNSRAALEEAIIELLHLYVCLPDAVVEEDYPEPPTFEYKAVREKN